MSPEADGLENAVQAYLDHLKAERGLSVHTVTAYRTDLRRYVAFLRGRGLASLAEVTPAVVQEYLMNLASQPLATASVGRMTVAVRGAHRFWAAEGLTGEDPSRRVTPPVPGRRLPHALSVDEVTRLIAAAGGVLPDSPPGELCDRALVELLYGTGARIAEAVALDVDDAMRMLADPEVGLRLTGKGNKQRLVPVGSYAREALQQWLVRGRPTLANRTAKGTPALFVNARGGRLTRQSAFNRIAALGPLAGLATEVSPHTLRHSYATHLIDGGADVRVVQELLGHASVMTTQVYTLITLDHLREVYRAAHPRAL